MTRRIATLLAAAFAAALLPTSAAASEDVCADNPDASWCAGPSETVAPYTYNEGCIDDQLVVYVDGHATIDSADRGSWFALPGDPAAILAYPGETLTVTPEGGAPVPYLVGQLTTCGDPDHVCPPGFVPTGSPDYPCHDTAAGPDQPVRPSVTGEMCPDGTYPAWPSATDCADDEVALERARQIAAHEEWAATDEAATVAAAEQLPATGGSTAAALLAGALLAAGTLLVAAARREA